MTLLSSRRMFRYLCPYCKQERDRFTYGEDTIECKSCGMTADKVIAGSALKTNSANKFKPS